MAREWFELTQSEILRKVYTKDSLHNALKKVFEDLPVKRGGVIADRDWTVNSNYPFMIKLHWKNYAYVTKKSAYFSKADGKYTDGNKRYTVSWVNAPKPIKITWRESSKIERSKGGTPEQERGSAWVFKRVLERTQGPWKDVQELMEDKQTYPQLVKIFRGNVDDTWLWNYYAQSFEFFKQFRGHTFQEFDRDSSEGFAEWINKEAVKRYKRTIGSKKDNWNPADIWITKGSTEALKQEINNTVFKGASTVHELNAYLRKKFKDHEIIGVSLKKVNMNKPATWVEVNVEGILLDTADYNFPVGTSGKPCSSMTANFDIKAGKDMFTQDVLLEVTSPQRDRTYRFQIKANSSEQVNQNLKFEATEIGAGAARLGKAPVDVIVQKSLHKLKSYKGGDKGFENNKNNRMFPNTSQKYIDNQDNWETKIKHLLSLGLKTDESNITKISENISKSFASGKVNASNTKCKLMGIQFFYCLANLSEDDLREFVTDMVFISQKEAMKKIDHFGPFGKIY
tara:strand:- start:629 stop:2161 length:1533 start_codon:yes stop_codon:yes gene_type:complete